LLLDDETESHLNPSVKSYVLISRRLSEASRDQAALPFVLPDREAVAAIKRRWQNALEQAA
jgi:hypothetical protein